jgi:hypothetical protein
MRAQFVFEKFNDESDPIGDMNIGTGNIDHLKVGSLLKAKHEFEVLDEDHFNYLRRVIIANMGLGASLDFRSIDKGRYIIVLRAEYENGIVKVHYVRTPEGKSAAYQQVIFVRDHVSPEKRVSFADNFFRTDQKNMNKYFEFIQTDIRM